MEPESPAPPDQEPPSTRRRRSRQPAQLTPAQEAEKRSYDQELKRLLNRAPNTFLALAFPGVVWQSAVESFLPAKPRIADLVWRVADSTGAVTIVHIELQTKVEKNISRRVAEYAFRLHLREKLPVRSLVVFLRPARTIPEPSFGWSSFGTPTMTFTYDQLRLWEVPQERLLQTHDYDLYPLAGLLKGASVDTLVETADRLAVAPLPPDTRDILTRSLVLLAGVRFPRDLISEVMRRKRMIENLWEESSLGAALEQLAEERGEARGEARGVEIGVEIGEARGVEIGEARGQMKAMRTMARLALEDRFGTLTEDILMAIDSANPETLQGVVLQASADTLAQARARLGLGDASQA